jgi:hypothetical protein
MLNTTTLKCSLYIVKSIGKFFCVTSLDVNDWPSTTFGYTRLNILNIGNLWFYLKSSLKRQTYAIVSNKIWKKEFFNCWDYKWKTLLKNEKGGDVI